jgi:hypothetical protein
MIVKYSMANKKDIRYLVKIKIKNNILIYNKYIKIIILSYYY